MRKVLVLLLYLLGLGGCATNAQLGNRISGTQSYVYATASKDITFEKAVSALNNLGFTLTNIDKQGGIIIGSKMAMSLRSLFITVNISETDKTKVTVIVRESGAIDSWDITGYYYKYQDAFYKNLKVELNSDGYNLSK